MPPQSSYARCPHGTTTRKQRTVAAAVLAFEPSAKGGARKLTVSDEAALNGILFALQTGIP